MPDDGRWKRVGGGAGIGFVVVAGIGGALSGVPPAADGKGVTYQNYFVEHQQLLAVQGWLYALAVPALLTFAVSVRRTLRGSGAGGGYLGELFLVGTSAIGTLLVVAMAMQIVIVQSANRLAPDLVFVLGVHFVAVVVGSWGFIVAATAVAYAFSVFAYGSLPRWTGCLAVLAAATSVLSSVGVFIETGPFSLEGGVSAWAPGASMVLWYLGTSIALLAAPPTSPVRPTEGGSDLQGGLRRSG